ncbi:Protein of unknown function [Aquiflexum balticum DSM 16537]|uniref:DUF2911 domain-containing protein n=1 Tax=Aquiflexum balticum DSM 16537 TaxID=758820 RepID=A0A1W2H548_9BACT|nr:DUF2911 domain-containing protein [Aquiflexum balticum]SMD43752.1 Protein of unknown function [Aquiflexum balticum DSM 16537]
MYIKHYTLIAASLIIISCSSNKTEEKEIVKGEHAQHDPSAHAGPSNSKSPRTAAMANIGSNHVHIDYSAPSVRGRQIFGGLVAYNEVWVTGAHSATSISFSEDIRLDGKTISKGKYALFTIPGEDEWVVIINKNWDQHLADDYDESKDVIRITISPEKLQDQVEQLNFKVENLGNKNGQIVFQWSDIEIQIPFESI